MSITTQGFKFHYPARGRKPSESKHTESRWVLVQIPLPRKGTETFGITAVTYLVTFKFKFHYPARGRKLGYADRVRNRHVSGSNSITPQGDGNPQDMLCRKNWSASSNSITPQGDGNCLPARDSSLDPSRSNSITPQGDGNHLSSYRQHIKPS